MRQHIEEIFNSVWHEQNSSSPPKFTDETILLETGLDSLGFAIIVTRLEEELGFDPFSDSENAFYPQTFREFVEFYEKNGHH